MTTEEDDRRSEALVVSPPRSTDPEGQLMKGRIAERLFGAASGTVLIDRFELVETIGIGGMGVVHRAKDPTLRREVALKLLHPELLSNDRERARLLREAQALAQLSHPNVVQLYEVGEHGDGLFLAMEYVAGVSLRKWQESKKREWQEVLEVYVQAGRGLAAAHARGLVHRDFKPSNVLVGIDGRVRVVDFGLARAQGLWGDVASPEVAQTRPRGGGSSLTRTGVVVGTPAYMSPEQRGNSALESASDQYSFCVALAEAMFGERPAADAPRNQFAPTEVGTDRAAAMPARARNLLVAAVFRGVRRTPEQRWPSMEALLEQLEQAGRKGGRSRWSTPGALVVVGLVGAFSWSMATPSTPSCDGLRSAAPQWSEGDSLALERAAAQLSVRERERLAESLNDSLRAYVGTWGGEVDGLCGREVSGAAVTESAHCLTTLSEEFSRTSRVLLDTPYVMVGAPESVAQLLPPTMCADRPELVASYEESDADLRALARASLLTAAGRLGEADRLYATLDATSGDEAPSSLRSRILLGRGEVHRQRGSLERAATLYRGAVEHAMQAGNNALEAEARAGLALVQAAAENYEGARWTGRQCLSRLMGEPVAAARCWSALAWAYSGPLGGANAVPMEHLAIMLLRGVYGPDSMATSHAWQHLADLYADAGQLQEARVLYERERDRNRDKYGAGHPAVLVQQGNLAYLDLAEGDPEAARDRLLRVVQGLEDAYGRTPKVARALIKLAEAEQYLDEIDEAWAHLRRAIELQAELLPQHEEFGSAIAAAAMLAQTTNDPERALHFSEMLGDKWGREAVGERNLVWQNVAYYRCVLRGCEGAAAAADRVDPKAVIEGGVALRLFADNVYALVELSRGDTIYARNYAQRVLRGVEGLSEEHEDLARAFRAEARWTLARAAVLDGNSEESADEGQRALSLAEGDAFTLSTLRSLDPELFAGLEPKDGPVVAPAP